MEDYRSGPYQCSHCDLVFPDMYRLLKHMTTFGVQTVSIKSRPERQEEQKDMKIEPEEEVTYLGETSLKNDCKDGMNEAVSY